MFSVGDTIVYENTGVCRIVGISTLQGMSDVDRHRQYYVLAPIYLQEKIYVPVDSDRNFMRPVLSKEEANALIDAIPSMHAEIYQGENLQDLTEHYRDLLMRHDCASLIELTMSIYQKRIALHQQKRKFGQTDEQYLKRGEELLFGELAYALGIDRASVREYIENRINRKAE